MKGVCVRALTVTAVGMSLALVATACGGEDPTATPAPTATGAGPTPAVGPEAPPLAEQWQERHGGTLVFATSKGVDSPNPFVTTVSVDEHIKEMWLEPLLHLADDGSLVPVLATSWVSNDDHSVWTFHLRRGVKFHDGQEMTSADVVWTVKYILNPDNAARGAGPLGPVIDSVEAVDRYTVRFNMKGSQPAFPQISQGINPLPVIPANSMETGVLRMSTPPSGTGPFKFESWTPGGNTVVVRNDDYWAGKPYLDKIVFQFVSSATGRANALRTGEIQMAERLGPSFANRVLAGEIRGISVLAPPLSGYRRIMFNVESPIFKDKNVRLAAVYGMDMQKLLDEAFFGLGYLVHLPVPPGSVWEEALLACCPKRYADPDKARALLAASEYNGEPVRLYVQRGREGVGESLSRQLREVGFNIDLTVLESGIYTEKQDAGDFDLTPEGDSFDGDPIRDNQANWRCEERERRHANRSRMCNPGLDALLDEYGKLADLDDRLEMFAKIMPIVHDEVIGKHMGWNYTRFFGWNDNVKGFANRGSGYTTRPVGGGLWRVYFEG